MSHQVFGDRYDFIKNKFWTFHGYLFLLMELWLDSCLFMIFIFCFSEVIFGYKNLEVQVVISLLFYQIECQMKQAWSTVFIALHSCIIRKKIFYMLHYKCSYDSKSNNEGHPDKSSHLPQWQSYAGIVI